MTKRRRNHQAQALRAAASEVATVGAAAVEVATAAVEVATAAVEAAAAAVEAVGVVAVAGHRGGDELQ